MHIAGTSSMSKVGPRAGTTSENATNDSAGADASAPDVSAACDAWTLDRSAPTWAQTTLGPDPIAYMADDHQVLVVDGPLSNGRIFRMTFYREITELVQLHVEKVGITERSMVFDAGRTQVWADPVTGKLLTLVRDGKSQGLKELDDPTVTIASYAVTCVKS